MTDEKQKKLTMIVMSGDFDKLFGAFTIASGAAAMGTDVTMFFTFWGLRGIKRNVRTGKGLFGRMVGIMYGGDLNRANPSKFSFGGMGRWMFKKMMRSKNVAMLPELRQLCIDLGVHFYACQTSMEVMEIDRSDMIEQMEDVVGVAFMLEQAEQSYSTLFI